VKSLFQAGAALLLVQALLVGAYFFFRPGSPSTVGEEPSGKAPPAKVVGRLPPLGVSDGKGTKKPLKIGTRPTLVHVWATWCPPCREELPGLLSLADEGELDVVAISLDPEWKAMEEFFGGRPPPQVVLGDAEQIQPSLKVHTLPVTFLVGSDLGLKLRFEGAQDWEDREFTGKWLSQD